MATKTSADLEPRVPSSCPRTAAISPEDVEPWRQSSFDLHQGLEVTEMPQKGPGPDSSPSESPNRPAARQFDGLAPEEVAQLAAMWWDQRRTLP
jgi:hypothetical protein